MKFFALFICFYFTTLTALPTVRVIKLYFAENCQSSCGKSTTKKSTSDDHCQKEKCILNTAFNYTSFLVLNQTYNFKTLLVPLKQVEKAVYHKIFIPKYRVVIWQPPETVFLIS